MRRLLIALVLLTVLSIPAHVLGQDTFKIEVVNDTKGKLTYQIHEVKAAFEEYDQYGYEQYSVFAVASGSLEPQARIVEPQDFPVGQYIITILLTGKGRLQVLKNHIIVNSDVVRILINSREILALKSV